MAEINDETALKLLNDAMPGMEWSRAGRLGFLTRTELTEAAATKLMNSLKMNTGMTADTEIRIRAAKKGHVIILGDPLGPDGINDQVQDKLMDPKIKAKLQADTAAAKAASGIVEKSANQSTIERNLNNLQAPPTPASTGSGTKATTK